MVVSESLQEVWGNAPWNPNGEFLLMGTRRLVSRAELWTRSDRCYHCSKRHTRDSVPCCVGGTVVWPNTCSWKIQSTDISQTKVLSLESLQPAVGKQDQQSPSRAWTNILFYNSLGLLHSQKAFCLHATTKWRSRGKIHFFRPSKAQHLLFRHSYLLLGQPYWTGILLCRIDHYAKMTRYLSLWKLRII